MNDLIKKTISKENLKLAILDESKKFEHYYSWLEENMPELFFEEVSHEHIMLIVHNLIGFLQQEFFSSIHLKRSAIVMCLNSPDADLRILKNYAMYGIKTYQSYISSTPPPFSDVKDKLRVAVIYFTEAVEKVEAPYSPESKEELRALVKKRNPDVTDSEFDELLESIDSRFLRALSLERLILAIDMYFRAKTRDNCQYEMRYNEDWKEKNSASVQIVLAWRNTPKHNFLYRLARVIHRHHLVMKRVNSCYINPYSTQSILLMSLNLHGNQGEAVWDACHVQDFLRDLVTVKFFASFDDIDKSLVSKGIVSGTMGNLLRAMVNFIHQALVNIDVNLYTIDNITEGLCRHPELTAKLCQAFQCKFDPITHDFEKYLQMRQQFLTDVEKLDTGQEMNDLRRKNILRLAMSFVHHTLKTNIYRMNYTALSFRLDPKYLDDIPFDRSQKFPAMPYAIFYIKGMHFFGFHIRFKDLARGGLRTVLPERAEQAEFERNNVFTECYNLAYTQHMKNKDIPEGGAKGVIFLKPYDRLQSESLILQKELEEAKMPAAEIHQKMDQFHKDQTTEYLYQAQRSFIESLITIINSDADGTIRAKYIVDYWKKPEYIYLGPDENMHDCIIQWIAEFSKKYGYKPGGAFISGKPLKGINHKEYGVTSRGVNVYMDEVLKYLNIDPKKEIFTVKMSGGPSGDVAGNQILNLHRFYPKTAKLIALTDGTGTISDPAGLDLDILADMFHKNLAIKSYPPEKLSEGGFLLDKKIKKEETAFVQHTLCWRKLNGKVIQDWLSGSEMNHLIRNNVHQTKADVFIPAGGRPRTLNENNVEDFLDHLGHPTAKAIIEGANLYLNNKARQALEKLGVLIIKDSSANKTGVICSSFEVLAGLSLGDDRFVEHKTALVKEILARLTDCAANEAELLLRTHRETGKHLTEISDRISFRINQFTDQLHDYLETVTLSNDPEDPLIKNYLSYCLPTLRKHFQRELLEEIPDQHKKAVIACHIAANLVYKKGLAWSPSIVEILPVLLQ